MIFIQQSVLSSLRGRVQCALQLWLDSAAPAKLLKRILAGHYLFKLYVMFTKKKQTMHDAYLVIISISYSLKMSICLA
jgi:hypothetical protein